MKRINSRQKGKRGELTVAKLLTKATGCEWRRTAQVRGKNDGAPDIECLDPRFSGVWVEVKDRAGWYVGCKAWADAWKTTWIEAIADSKKPVLIWRTARGKFVATISVVLENHTHRCVTTDEIEIALQLAEW